MFPRKTDRIGGQTERSCVMERFTHCSQNLILVKFTIKTKKKSFQVLTCHSFLMEQAGGYSGDHRWRQRSILEVPTSGNSAIHRPVRHFQGSIGVFGCHILCRSKSWASKAPTINGSDSAWCRISRISCKAVSVALRSVLRWNNGL